MDPLVVELCRLPLNERKKRIDQIRLKGVPKFKQETLALVEPNFREIKAELDKRNQLIPETVSSHSKLDKLEDRSLRMVPYYWGIMSREDVDLEVRKLTLKKGSFLLRYSLKKEDLVLSVWDKTETKHICLNIKPNQPICIREANRWIKYDTVDAFIDYYITTGRPFSTHFSNLILKHPIFKPKDFYNIYFPR